MSDPICQVCDYVLDERGRCAACFRVRPEDMEQDKFTTVYWTVCEQHGALEAVGRPVSVGKGWMHRCAACDWQHWDKAQSFKERIMLPKEIYQPVIDERLARFNA